jgi:photosystem II stability/assembly factor-like uncharacterized protein
MNHGYLIINLIILSTIARAQWEPIGPFGGYLRTLAIAPSNESILYTVSQQTPGRFFVSSDQGNTWTYRSTVPNIIYSLTVDPENPDIIYAGSFGNIYKTTDAGNDWKTCSLSCHHVNDIIIHPETTSTIYATGMSMYGGQGVATFMRSYNQGDDWEIIPLNSYCGFGNSLALDPFDPSVLYIGGYYWDTANVPIVFKTTDGGTNFVELPRVLPSYAQSINSIAIHPTNNSILYAGTSYNGLYRSTDQGISWDQVIYSGMNFSKIRTCAASPDVAYAASDTIVFRTSDAGQSWHMTGNQHGKVRKEHRSLIVSPTSENFVYTADYTGFYRSTNGGALWTESNYCITTKMITSIAVVPSNPSIVYIYVDKYGTYKSTDSGISWNRMSTPFSCRLAGLTVDNSNPDKLLAIEGDG